MEANADNFRIERGLGVYLPSFVPHWVETESGISVSFSIPFYTHFCERAEGVYRVNRWLRKMKLSPPPPGASQPIDRHEGGGFPLLVDVARRPAQTPGVAPGPRRRP